MSLDCLYLRPAAPRSEYLALIACAQVIGMMDVDGEKADGTARYLGATYKVC